MHAEQYDQRRHHSAGRRQGRFLEQGVAISRSAEQAVPSWIEGDGALILCSPSVAQDDDAVLVAGQVEVAEIVVGGAGRNAVGDQVCAGEPASPPHLGEGPAD